MVPSVFKFLRALYRGTLDVLAGNSGGGLRVVASKWRTETEAEFNTANLVVDHLQGKVAEVCGFLFSYFSPSHTLLPGSTSTAGFSNPLFS